MLREIVLDTETTGMEPSEGHKLVEIGCVELINHMPTGNVWHKYINPERDVPIEAANVHGLTTERLKDEPVFAEMVGDFLEFIKDDWLVIHNAEFDLKFLNAEIKALGFPSLNRRKVIDTLQMAREKFPGSPANLDALCRRFKIDNSNRTFHGALLDSELLAEVYMELLGGRQRGFDISVEEASKSEVSYLSAGNHVPGAGSEKREPRNFVVPDSELELHEKMVADLKEPIWKKMG
jgi:DNA polymerase-3 subunit epsilon